MTSDSEPPQRLYLSGEELIQAALQLAGTLRADFDRGVAAGKRVEIQVFQTTVVGTLYHFLRRQLHPVTAESVERTSQVHAERMDVLLSDPKGTA